MNRSFSSPWIVAIVVGLAFLWAFASVFAALIATWWSVADYSHGFFVIPIALYLAWTRRASFPAQLSPAPFVGLLLLLASMSVSYLGTIALHRPMEEYPIIPALAGVLLVGGGWPLLRWALPMVLFLLFMIPLPHALATHLSLPLQHLGAAGAGYLLQTVGIPSLVEGTYLQLENARLNVAFACSGLQMIISFGAVCTGIALLSNYNWIGKLVIALSSIPIAVACNILRIALIAWAQRFDLVPPKELHDAGGLVIVPLTVAMVFFGIWLFEKCFPRRNRPPVQPLPAA